jgi:hypothetical protein
MSYDVSKIIEESVKDIIDSDKEDILQEAAEGNLDPQGSAAEDQDNVLLDKETFEESRSFLKEYIEKDTEGKK